MASESDKYNFQYYRVNYLASEEAKALKNLIKPFDSRLLF